MPEINKTDQTEEVREKQIISEEPNLPKEGLLVSEEIKKTVAEEKNKIRKWRRIILEIIKQPGSRNKTKQEQDIDAKTAEEPDNDLQQIPKKSKQNIKNKLIKPEKTASRKPWFFKFLKITIYIILVIILIIVGLGFGFYNFGWQEKTINKISQIIPYPAVLIKTPCGYKNISYSDFKFDFKAISYFYEQKKISEENFIIPDLKQIESDVSNKKIKNELIKCLAKEREVTVSDIDIKTELEKTIAQAGSQEVLEEIIKNLYDWDLKIFEQKVLYSYIIEEKLAQSIQSDSEINIEAKQKIENLYQQISENTKDFYDLAKEFSEDTNTSQRGGDINWIEKGQLDETLENSAFNLEIGETSEILQTNAGYHIIKVTDKKTTPEEVEQVRISHILIKTRDLDNWINEELKKVKIYKFI